VNLLFIGPYRQPDGWGAFSRSVISSLLSIEEINLTTRPLFLARGPTVASQMHPKILQCESNKQDNYDVLIQHSLPNFMIGSNSFDLNIGITSLATNGSVVWDNHLELLDKIVVSTEAEKACASPKLQDKTYAIGGVTEGITPAPQDLANRFSFYALGGLLETKSGLLPLLQAYLSEFHVNESVSLVIHTQNPQLAQELINATAQTLGIYGGQYYPHVHIVAENPQDSLHKSCQCIIDVPITRGFNEEVAKSLLYGNTPIVLAGSGMDEYVDESNGWVVKSKESIVICPDRPLPDIFTARESCLLPDMLSLKECMRDAFNNRISYNHKSTNGKKCSNMFSVAKQRDSLKEVLCLS
jgi:hypothetical protein